MYVVIYMYTSLHVDPEAYLLNIQFSLPTTFLFVYNYLYLFTMKICEVRAIRVQGERAWKLLCVCIYLISLHIHVFQQIYVGNHIIMSLSKCAESLDSTDVSIIQWTC